MDKPSSLPRQQESQQLLMTLNSGQLLMVDPHRHNAVIICKAFHAEFAGPGAAVGGALDIDSSRIIPVGDAGLLHPGTYQERQTAYAKRMHWMRWLQQVTNNTSPSQRARVLLFSLQEFFSPQDVDQIPSEILARLVGVLPETIENSRQPFFGKPRLSYSQAC